jgi:hypothetical protein
MHIGDPGHNEYMRFMVRVDEIDTEQPLEKQLADAKQSLRETVTLVEQELEAKIEQELGRRLQ